MRSTGRNEVHAIPSHTSKELADVDAALSIRVAQWMRRHGKTVRPKVTEEQKAEFQECFRLMDEDGSGSIDNRELGAAFKLLGISMTRKETEDLITEVDRDHTGDIGWDEFLEIMTDTLQKMAEDPDRGNRGYQLPFGLMATQYRRKRYMEGLMLGTKKGMTEMVQLADQQLHQEAMVEVQREYAAGLDNPATFGPRQVPRSSKIPSRVLQRLSRMRLDDPMLRQLSPTEVKVLTRILEAQARASREVQQGHSGRLSRAGAALGPVSARERERRREQRREMEVLQASTAGVRYPGVEAGVNPKQGQLLQMPQGNLQLAFSRSIIKVPGSPRVGTPRSSQYITTDADTQQHQQQQQEQRQARDTLGECGSSLDITTPASSPDLFGLSPRLRGSAPQLQSHTDLGQQPQPNHSSPRPAAAGQASACSSPRGSRREATACGTSMLRNPMATSSSPCCSSPFFVTNSSSPRYARSHSALMTAVDTALLLQATRPVSVRERSLAYAENLRANTTESLTTTPRTPRTTASVELPAARLSASRQARLEAAAASMLPDQPGQPAATCQSSPGSCHASGADASAALPVQSTGATEVEVNKAYVTGPASPLETGHQQAQHVCAASSTGADSPTGGGRGSQRRKPQSHFQVPLLRLSRPVSSQRC